MDISGQKPEKVNILKYVSVGADLSGPISKFLNTGRNEFELSAIVGNFHDFQFDAEAGFLSFDLKTDSGNRYNYNLNGNFGRIGVDYNTFKKNLPGENNYVLFGLRYGYSTMQHSAKDIVILDKKWGDRKASFPETSFSSQWIELTGGLRIQLYKNIGAGWTARFKYMIRSGVSNDGIKPYYIPGFGKGAENIAFGFTYSIYYTIPIVKMRLE
jgi:hypothetical protein